MWVLQEFQGVKATNPPSGWSAYSVQFHLDSKIGTELINIWVFPKIGVPENVWFIMENPIKMDDFGGTIIFGNTHISTSVCQKPQ